MELKDYVRVIRARGQVVVAIVLIVVVAAVVGSLVQSPVYQAEARVLVTEQNPGTVLIGSPLPDQTNSSGFVQTQVELIGSASLVERVITALNLRTTLDDLMSRLTVSEVGQTNVVTIDVRDGDARRAVKTANALADEYVVWSRDVKRASIRAAADEVEQRLADAQKRGAKVQSATLADQLEKLRMSAQLETGSGIVLPATEEGALRVAPSLARNGALGLAVGLLCALVGAVLADYFDNTIKSADEAEEVYGARVLAHIPVEKSDEHGERHLAVVERPSSSEAEAYRILRSSLHFNNPEHEVKTLLVASPESSEGRSSVAANLAATLAQAGKQVTLIVCDFRQPAAEQYFGAESTLGLSDILTASTKVVWTSAQAASVFQRPEGLEGLRVIAAGTTPANPSELLESPQMGNLIARLRTSMDWIIMDTPPLLEVADAVAAVQWADGVLAVVRDGKSTRESAEQGRAQLENAGAHILGVIVWNG